MKQVYQKSYLSKELRVDEVPAPVLKGSGVIVRNAVSLISPGTERATISFARKNIIAKISSQPERVKQLLRKVKQIGLLETAQLTRRKLENPIPLGYSSAGIITDLSSDLHEFVLGDRVACAGSQFANHAEMAYVPKNLCVKLPDNLSFEEGAFVAPGAIALHGVRLAEIGLGETVVVIGLGLIGQLACQLVAAQGGIAIGIDLDPERLELAKSQGATHTFLRSDPHLFHHLQKLTHERGADVVLITAATASHDPVTLAGEIARDRAKVVVVGDVGMNIPRNIYYHKELSVIVSRSYGPGRYDDQFEFHGQDYPAGYIRWSERENMNAFLALAADGKINLLPLIQQRVQVDEAVQVYDQLAKPKTPQPLGVIIEYPTLQENTTVNETRVLLVPPRVQSINGPVQLGVIGAGNFLKTLLLPLCQQQPKMTLMGLSATSGLSAKTTGEQFGFQFCTTDVQEIFDETRINAVLIGTRHDSHAELFCDALKHGKHVLMEKPLATTPEELEACIAAQREHPQLLTMIGFNRRFSPLTQLLKKQLLATGESKTPISITYRVHAGPLPADSWLHQAGGRIVGEVCHFVDWCVYVTESEPIAVTAHKIYEDGDGPNFDVMTQIQFANGSTAQIQYIMRSPAMRGKERIEVFHPLLSAEIDDFKVLRYGRQSVDKTYSCRTPEKGHREELAAFCRALETGEHVMPFSEIVQVSRAVFAIETAMKTGERIILTSES